MTNDNLSKLALLSSEIVQLQPLTIAHIEALKEAACDGELWRLVYTNVPHPDQMEAAVLNALELQQTGTQQAFVVVRQRDQKVVGATRYYDIDTVNKRLAIGYTWYAQSAQRTAVNTHCKYLLLKHAFEQLHCLAVAFHTDYRNQRSRTAIKRLGAIEEGVLRRHKIMPDGYYRDTVCFSILDKEWLACKKHLQSML